MNITVVTSLIAALAALSGITLGWLARNRTIKQDAKQEASAGAALHTDVEYIKRGVDDIRVEMRMQGQRIDAIAERVTRVEESAKQAHHRINELKSLREE